MSSHVDAKIVVVDDQPANVTLLLHLLERLGYTNVVGLTDSAQAVPVCQETQPDLLLLDLQMPAPDGYEVLRLLEPLTHGDPSLPVVVLTADVTVETKRRALTMGAKDFLTKPYDHTELALRVANLLETRALQIKLQHHAATLEQRVLERTADLERARRETLERLALAGEFRDDNTSEHAVRVGRTASLLAAGLDMSAADVALVAAAAPLHDIGKIAVSDEILLKPGLLTPDEFEIMKTHATIGAQMLEGSSSGVLQQSAVIAATHHERWNGQGYPEGLAGTDIAIFGRLTAVADVFDALTHDRPYKVAWPLGDAITEIRRQSGLQFDPDVVRAFEGLDHEALLSGIETARDDRAHAG